MSGGMWAQVALPVLGAFLEKRRWYGDHGRKCLSLTLECSVPLEDVECDVFHLTFDDGTAARYFVPLALSDNPPEGAGIVQLSDGRWVADAVSLPASLQVLTRFLETGDRAGALRAERVASLRDRDLMPLRVGHLEQSNSAFFLGTGGFAKVFRRLPDGLTLDWEICRFLAGRGARVPEALGAILLDGLATEPVVLVQLSAQVDGTDAWSHSQSLLAELLAPGVPPELAREDPAVGWCRQLGVRTGELHRALLGDGRDPAFAPQLLTEAFLQTAADRSRALGVQALTQLESTLPSLDAGTAALAQNVLNRRESILERLGQVPSVDPRALRIRCHGDYHLGQVLWKNGDAVILDFEGEPARSLEERRLRQSPLKDVAGMLRSFDYAAQAALKVTGGSREVALSWRDAADQAFLSGYLAAVAGTPLVPADTAEFGDLLNFHVAEKLLYELLYELGNRVDWVGIPLAGLAELFA